MARKFKEPNDAALIPSNHPISIRKLIDFDYKDELSEAERLWLSQFADEYYGGDFRSAKPIHPVAQRLAIWREKKRLRDHGMEYGGSLVSEEYAENVADEARDWADHKDSLEYEALVARIRPLGREIADLGDKIKEKARELRRLELLERKGKGPSRVASIKKLGIEIARAKELHAAKLAKFQPLTQKLFKLNSKSGG